MSMWDAQLTGTNAASISVWHVALGSLPPFCIFIHPLCNLMSNPINLSPWQETWQMGDISGNKKLYLPWFFWTYSSRSYHKVRTHFPGSWNLIFWECFKYNNNALYCVSYWWVELTATVVDLFALKWTKWLTKNPITWPHFHQWGTRRKETEAVTQIVQTEWAADSDKNI